MKNQDTIFQHPLAEIVDFKFDESVVDVFPDMINRSVPGYSTVVNMIGIIVQRFVQPNSNIYDLGCSLGAASLSIRNRLSEENHCRIIAVDNAPAMLEQCKKHVAIDGSSIEVETCLADITEVDIQHASVVVLNLTLQFVPPDKRLDLIESIYNGLLPGGCVILTEKTDSSDSMQGKFHADLHYAFKKANGYSDMEISQKRTALENVLIPETMEEHVNRLSSTGFSSVIPWFQCFNFTSIAAIK
ncbi:MAG: carboxy-S-adenosyl-L-methionine synthase CmoA [Gammaproteobacteria bacterium]